MASPLAVIFAVLDPATGSPVTGIAGSMSFYTYKNDLGTNLAQPSIVEVGGGLYSFTPTFTANRGIGYIINVGNEIPGHYDGYLRPEDFNIVADVPSPQKIVFAIYDSANVPKTGATPVFDTYKDDSGANLSQPTINEIGGGLYSFNPTFPINKDIAYIINTGFNPMRYSGYARAEDFANGTFIATGAVSVGATVTVSFSSGFTLDALSAFVLNPANWSITGSPGVTVQSVALVANQIVLTTTTPGSGASYNLLLPAGITANGGTYFLLGPYTLPFIGSVVNPTIVFARSVDEHIVDIIFSFAPDTILALDITKYTISGGLIISSVEKLTDTTYRLHTSSQAIGVSYTVTWAP